MNQPPLEVLKLARDALLYVDDYDSDALDDIAEKVIAAIEQLEKAEPVAWIVPEFGFLFPTKDAADRYLRNIESEDSPTPIYTNPAAPGEKK